MSRSKFDSGSLPSQKLLNLSACHPFVQQECEGIRHQIAARADLGCRPLGRYRVSCFYETRGSSNRTCYNTRMHKVKTRAFHSARPGQDQRAGVQKVRMPQTRPSSLFIVVVSENRAFFFSSSDVIAFGSNPRGTDETWCIDTRGVLTLSIDRGTYQRLGLLGTPLPWRPHQNRYSTWIPSPPPLPF